MECPSLRVELRNSKAVPSWRVVHKEPGLGVVVGRPEHEALDRPTGRWRLAAEAVEGLALALEGVDDVHGGDSLAAGVLGVGHGVTDHVLQEDLENTAGLLVDEARDALDATTACEPADGGLGDALDVVAKDLAVAL